MSIARTHVPGSPSGAVVDTRLPNLLIIGAMKSGTTSLHHYLDQHPDIAMSRVKEINFFLDGHFDKGIEWYRSHFDATAAVRGESSTSYTKYPQRPGVAARVGGLLPDARLVYILRDPIERTVSHYLHAYHRRRERRSLRDALDQLADNPYVDPSRYYMQLNQYLGYFPLLQIHILTMEELAADPQAALNRIVSFVGANAHAFNTDRVDNASDQRGRASSVGRIVESYRLKRLGRRLAPSIVATGKRINQRLSTRTPKPILDLETEGRLRDHLRDDVAALRAVTGREFSDWSV